MNHLPPVNGPKSQIHWFWPYLTLLNHLCLHFWGCSFACFHRSPPFLLPHRIDFHFLLYCYFFSWSYPLYSPLGETDEYQWWCCEKWLKEGKAKEKALVEMAKMIAGTILALLVAINSVCPAQIFPPSHTHRNHPKVSLSYLKQDSTAGTANEDGIQSPLSWSSLSLLSSSHQNSISDSIHTDQIKRCSQWCKPEVSHCPFSRLWDPVIPFNHFCLKSSGIYSLLSSSYTLV